MLSMFSKVESSRRDAACGHCRSAAARFQTGDTRTREAAPRGDDEFTLEIMEVMEDP